MNKVNEIQISYQENANIYQTATVNSSADAGHILFKNWNKNTIELNESFKVLLLNNSNRVKGIFELSSGGITSTLVDMRMLFSVVLKSLSVGIILAHNHPSGKASPSQADRDLTQKIIKAGKLFDVKVLDHLIILPNGKYYSFADNGIL